MKLMMTMRLKETAQIANLISSLLGPKRSLILMKVAVNHWLNQTTMTTMMILAMMKVWIGTSWRRKLSLLTKLFQIVMIEKESAEEV